MSTEQQKRNSFLMVLATTLLMAVAQTLIKSGASSLGENIGLVGTAIGILTTPPLFAGYSLYGLVMVVMVIALRHAELSAIYPIISLSYVWVAVISVVIFGEAMNPFKLGGIAVIVTGVAVLGIGSKSSS